MRHDSSYLLDILIAAREARLATFDNRDRAFGASGRTLMRRNLFTKDLINENKTIDS